ncbi:flagellar export chaperone FliS [Paenibacillus sp. Soil766]|uniref:flagellar export chaperone FliS n=1 Tax=Paenibacillus sp. Soil766 TaxID=1736404 RepID=UPI00070C7C79|nr:flagellar export chaperone FliS [Paenibacillus sp. Soil766]KRE97939.1 flagellar export chaperone FliS [Paenibacillus sp. Soil766]
MIQPQQNKYLETTIQSATPAQLLILLCDGAIRFCKQFIEALKVNNYEEANRNVIKVQDIIKEFIITLDLNAPISQDLLVMYDYIEFRLLEANMHKSMTSAEEVLGYLQELKSTWMEANKIAVSAKATGTMHG